MARYSTTPIRFFFKLSPTGKEEGRMRYILFVAVVVGLMVYFRDIRRQEDDAFDQRMLEIIRRSEAEWERSVQDGSGFDEVDNKEGSI